MHVIMIICKPKLDYIICENETLILECGYLNISIMEKYYKDKYICWWSPRLDECICMLLSHSNSIPMPI